jgi:LytS/YehU family sensor histidine kinase
VTSLLTRPEVGFFDTSMFLLPFIVTFYVSVFILNLYQQKGILWIIASFFIVFIVMASLGYLYIYLFLPKLTVILFTTRDFKPFMQDALRGYVRFFSFALLYFYIQKTLKNQLIVRRLEQEKAQKEIENWKLKQQELKAQKEKLQYEYAFLRSQINPHFLHNTLNTFFSEAMQFSPVLANNILKLSSIMRYSMESLEFDSGKVNVRKELEHLETLIEINNLRFGETQTIIYDIKGELRGQMVPPLSFITIVENAFKYGDISAKENPLIINVVLRPNEVYFYCKNKIRNVGLQLSSNNIGISNLEKRLDVAFKDKYDMKVTKENDVYIFELRVSN